VVVTCASIQAPDACLVFTRERARSSTAAPSAPRALDGDAEESESRMPIMRQRIDGWTRDLARVAS
jgi:hypothetical protein